MLYFKNLQKISKFAKIRFFFVKSSYIVKMFATTKSPKNDKIYNMFKSP